MKRILKVLIICLLVALAACKNNKATTNTDAAGTFKMGAPAAQDEASGVVSSDATNAEPPAESPDKILNAGSPAPTTDWDKKIIKNADVTVEVKDFAAYDKVIHGTTKKFAAYIAGEQQTKSDAKIENVITIKVPVDQFELLVNSFEGDDAKIVEKRITSEDVTDQLVDTKARIEAKKQVRDRYLELLKQSKSMKDILEVQKEVNAIQEELEAAEGRVQYLSHQSAYSTVNLTYFETLNGASGSDSSFFVRLREAFKTGSSIITGCIILLATFWPLLLGGIALWWIVKRGTMKFSLERKK